MNTLAKLLAAAVVLSSAAALAQFGLGYTCTDGVSWVRMLYGQQIGSTCEVLMPPNPMAPSGWVYFGSTML